MRTLIYDPIFTVSKVSLWEIFTQVENYPKYIKYCQKAELIGDFKVGSIWSDWSTVVWLPLKINHEIIKIEPEKELFFQIKLPLGGKIEQRFLFYDQDRKTKLDIEITIDIPNKVLDFLFGRALEYRNRQMIEATIDNFKRISFTK